MEANTEALPNVIKNVCNRMGNYDLYFHPVFFYSNIKLPFLNHFFQIRIRPKKLSCGDGITYSYDI